MLVRGDQLTFYQHRQVLAAFVHRWTFENARQSYGGLCPGCVQQRRCGGKMTVNGRPWHEYHAPLTTDTEWLKRYAFHFTKDGRRLKVNRHHAEPV
jgi:hypothetical protein